MNKDIKTIIKIHILSCKANPSPPLGSILGQQGVNIMSFCKQFNEKTSSYETGIPIPTVITVYKDKSFSFFTKKPTISYLLKSKLGIKKGSSKATHEIIGILDKKALKEIIDLKRTDLTALDELKIINTIIGSSRSMGIQILLE